MKLLLLMTVIAACLAIGNYLAARLDERTKILSQFITLLEEASVRMTYTADNLARLFSDNFAQYRFREDQPFAEQFRTMIREFKDTLTKEDISLLDDFTRDLGASDTASQQRHIRLYITLLSQQFDAAREDAKRKGRLYRILPLSVGITAAILLI